MPKDNIDYSNTIIYKIYCKNENITDVYVGHTTNFSQRKYAHKMSCKKQNIKLYNVMRENGGWDNWEMVEIARYNCKNSSEARIKEQHHYELLNSSLNSYPPFQNKLQLYCSECNKQFASKRELNLHNHKTNLDIINELNVTYENINNLNIKYECKICNYTTIRKNNFERHNLSEKHVKLLNISKNKNIEQNKQNNKNENKIEHNEFIKYDCICKKQFKTANGLNKHQQICHEFQNEQLLNIKESSVVTLTNLVLEVVKQNKELLSLNNEAQKQNQQLANKLVEMCGNTTNNNLINNHSNNNNKTFNLNVFLNETCKDAMNINEFIDSLQLQLSDLEDVGKLGFVDGISNIIVKNLKALDVHKRPVHCADKKREVIYIKDDNKWEKDNDDKQKLRKAIKNVAFKNEKLLPKFKELHPGCNYSESKYSDHYSKLVIEALGGSGNNDIEKQDKIIRNIVKEIVIDKS